MFILQHITFRVARVAAYFQAEGIRCQLSCLYFIDELKIKFERVINLILKGAGYVGLS